MRPLTMNGKGKTLLLIISLAFNLGACLAVVVRAQGGELAKPQRRGGGRHHEALSSKLDLSPEQDEILSTSRELLFEELRAIKLRLHEEGAMLAELLTAAELDTQAVSDQAERVAGVRNEIHQRMVQHLVSMREVLEPDQLESFKDFASKVLSRSGRGGRHKGEFSRNGAPGREP